MNQDRSCSRIGSRVTAAAGIFAPIVVGIMARVMESAATTDSTLQFVAGGTGTVWYALINTRNIGYKGHVSSSGGIEETERQLMYIRRGVGSKGQLNQASKNLVHQRVFSPPTRP